MRMLIESANAPIVGVDNAGRVTEWNSKASANPNPNPNLTLTLTLT